MPMHIQQWFPINNAFTQAECDRAQKLCDTVSLAHGGVIGDLPIWQQRLARNVKSGWILSDEADPDTLWLFKKFMQLADDVNKRTFQFEIDHVEALHYLEYGFGQHYVKHVDNGSDAVAARKLTLVLQLSHGNEYLGGNLSIDSQARSRHAPRGRGSVAIFPSHLPHKAGHVWFGKRKALVAWINGKKPLS